MKKISVSIPNNEYNIFIGKQIFKSKFVDNFLRKRNYTKILIVADENAYKFHKNKFQDLKSNYKTKTLVLSTNEKMKNLRSVNLIYKEALNFLCDRKSLFLAFGGGIIGDIVGFASATYMRGIDFVQIPTTLLAAVDSSVGGKTGVNFQKIKNIIGSFKQPEAVFIDLEFIETLPEEEIRCGLGEIVKYAFISNKEYFDFINQKIEKFSLSDYKLMEHVIIESVKFKASVVEADEKEKSLRQILNFGHTFGHAYETILNYKIKHGEAVAAGCASALILSCKLNILNQNTFQEGISLLSKFKLNHLMSKINPMKAIEIMKKDKKNKDGKINFVLIKNIGEIYVNFEAPQDLVLESIEETKKIIF